LPITTFAQSIENVRIWWFQVKVPAVMSYKNFSLFHRAWTYLSRIGNSKKEAGFKVKFKEYSPHHLILANSAQKLRIARETKERRRKRHTRLIEPLD